MGWVTFATLILDSEGIWRGVQGAHKVPVCMHAACFTTSLGYLFSHKSPGNSHASMINHISNVVVTAHSFHPNILFLRSALTIHAQGPLLALLLCRSLTNVC